MNEISESYPYESESMGFRNNRRSHDIYEDNIKREDNDLDFELDLWVYEHAQYPYIYFKVLSCKIFITKFKPVFSKFNKYSKAYVY